MPSIQIWDRLRALFKQSNIYRSDNLFRDQHDLAKVLSGGNIIDFSKQSAILEQTNLQINRLERYKDFDMMDEVGEISLALDTYADESCVTGDTRVPLLDGTCPTIKELAEKGIDNKFWVYSYDITLGKLVPALANGARVSGVNSKIFKVNLDDGMSIRCTGDHLFMLRSGEYRRAMDLKPHDSLMPLYRSKKSSFQEEKPYEFEETVQRRYLEKSFNHKVVSVEDAGIAEKVYDIEVPEYHNFAAGNLNSHVIIHNSLVDAEVKHAVIVKANNSNMKKIIEDFLYDTILIDNQIRPMIRYLCKFGDFISEIIPTKHRDGVSSFRFINVYNFTRIQTKYGDLVGFFYQDPAISGPQFLQPWQVIHMRLTTYDNVYWPYGRCLDTNSRVWTPYGSTALKDIQKGDEVYSFDTAIQKPVITKVLDKVISGVKPTLIIKTKHRAIQVTPEHPVLAIGGVYVLAEDFVIGDEVILPKFHNGIDRGCQWTEYDNCSDDYLVEKIISIEDGGEIEVGDIQVESGYHNFIADGVVIHNSILDGSRKDFKRLRLMEDAALVYRITRSAEKRVFSIPVGNIPPKEVPQYLELIARGFKKHKYVDPATGTLNERYWPTIQDDDFFLPKRADGSGPTIDTLPGAENLDAIADIEYFKKKMVAGLKIPFSRLGIGGQHEPDGKSLAQVSPEFAKSVQWIQNEVIAGLKKLVVVHLALRGHTVGDMRGFDLHMTSASAIDELYRIEAWNTRADIMANLKDIGWFPPEWIISRFTDMSPDEILDLKKIQEKNELSDMLKKENIDPDQKKLIQEYIGFIERSTMGTKDKIIEHNGLVSLINSNELDFLPKPNINDTLAEDGSVKIDDCLVKTNINEDESKEAIKLIKNLLEVSDDVPKISSVITEEDIAEIDANKSDMIIK